MNIRYLMQFFSFKSIDKALSNLIPNNLLLLIGFKDSKV